MQNKIPRQKICTLDGFLRQFVEQHRNRPDQPFCFILGAGASRDSGIKTGGEMAEDWLKKLHEDQNHSGLSLDEWIKTGNLDIPDFDSNNPSRFYSQLYELLYQEKEQAGFSYLETLMEGIEPSFGYSVLSYLLSSTHHRILITTNFDNLVTDSLAIHAGTFPIVVNEDSLVPYVRANVHRPLVAKIHGSLGFKPKSKDGELTLSDDWKKALAAIFQTHTPIVIGYDGNDGSLMKLLSETSAESPPEFLWWCYHCKSGDDHYTRAEEQPEHVHNLVLNRPAQFVPVPGFDLLMLRLLTILEKEVGEMPDLVKRLEQRTKSRLKSYKAQRNKLGADLAALAPNRNISGRSPEESDLTAELALLAKNTKTKPWWQWQNEINNLSSAEEQENAYQKALSSLPKSSELLGNYALFLMQEGKDHDKSEKFFKLALSTDASNAINHGNYALFLRNVRHDYEKSEEFFKKAVEIDPKNKAALINYANFLYRISKDNIAAETLYRELLEKHPKNADALGSYANFLRDTRNDLSEANDYYLQALKVDPDHAINLINYACYLMLTSADESMVEKIHLQAIKANPNNSNALGNYGQFLTSIGRFEEGVQYLRDAWIHRKKDEPGNQAEFSFSLWLSTLLSGKEQSIWEKTYKHYITLGFPRHKWSFTKLIKQANERLPAKDLKYIKALAAAFLDESSAKLLHKFPRWESLEPINPDLVNSDGTLREA